MAEIIAQVSNLCLPRRDAVTMGVEGHMVYLQEVKECDGAYGLGYDGGYEITPAQIFTLDRARYIFASKDLHQRNDAGDVEQPLYTSVHQSWAHGLERTALIGQHASLNVISNMANGQLPAVVFAGHSHRGKSVNFEDYGFRGTSIQPVADMLDGLRVTLPSHYESRMWRNLQSAGVDELTIDPHHLLRAHKDNPNIHVNRKLFFDAVRAHDIPIRRVHVSAGRVDCKNEDDRKRSMKDLRGLIAGNLASTALGDVLLETHEIWREQNAGNPDAKLPAVVEIPLAGLHLALSEKFGEDKARQFLSSKLDWAGVHAIISNNVRSFYEGLPAPDAAA